MADPFFSDHEASLLGENQITSSGQPNNIQPRQVMSAYYQALDDVNFDVIENTHQLVNQYLMEFLPILTNIELNGILRMVVIKIVQEGNANTDSYLKTTAFWLNFINDNKSYNFETSLRNLLPLRAKFAQICFRNNGAVRASWLNKLVGGEDGHNAYRYSIFQIFAAPDLKNVNVNFVIQYHSRLFDISTSFGDAVECRLFPADMITQIIQNNEFALEAFSILSLTYQNLSHLILAHPQIDQAHDWSNKSTKVREVLQKHLRNRDSQLTRRILEIMLEQNKHNPKYKPKGKKPKGPPPKKSRYIPRY